MKRILPLLLLLTAFYAQALPAHLVDTTRKSKKPSFYLYYKCYGNRISVIEPQLQVVVIKGSRYNYSYVGRNDRMIKTIRKGHFRRRSIDSILNQITSLADSTIKKVNPFVMGGNTHLLTITNGTDTTKFKLSNTFNATAFKIVNIINRYLPRDDRIWFTEELIELEKESPEWFDKAEEEKKKRDSMQAVLRDSL